MPSTDFSVALDILRSLYRHTRTVEKFAESFVFSEGRKAMVVEPLDSDRYKSFVQLIYVCSDKELEQVPSCNEICTWSELLAFVLNNIRRKRKRNILAHGYDLRSVADEKRNADIFKFQGSLTQSASYIHGSDMWKKLLMRFGTDMAKYLLESCSLYLAVPPSCIVQMSGIPVYDRVAIASASPRFSLQPRCKQRKSGQFGKHQRFGNQKRKNKFEDPSVGKSRSRINLRVNNRKQKRETEQVDERRDRRKRVRLEDSSRQVGTETVEEEQLISLEQHSSVMPLENIDTGSKELVCMQATRVSSEAGPPWRSGVFPPSSPSQCFIRTLGLLYGGRGMRGFLLNRKKKSAVGVQRLNGQDLIRVVFFEGVAYLNGVKRKPKKLPQRFFNMVPLFSLLLRRHRKYPYSRILHMMCPLLGDGAVGEEELVSLLPQHCAAHRVYLFVRECLSSIIPHELWGSDQNRLHFFTRMRGFLHNGKSERLSVAELLWKMKINDCNWLKISKTGRVPPSELSYRTKILGQFLAWVLDGFVVSLVRACFYVTESVGQKNALRFYRQEVWTKMQDLAFRDHISKGQMEELTPAQVASLPKTKVISCLRFIPKTDGMRPITRIKGTDAKTRLHQGQVRNLLDVLRASVNRTPSLLGATVWGMTDIHRVLRPLAMAQKDKPQPLYFVKVDVSGAYESLPHDKLMEVVNQVLSPVHDREFAIRRYAKIWVDSHEGLKKSFVRQADFMADHVGSSMKGFVMSMQAKGKAHHAVLVEQPFSLDILGRDASQFFTQMLTGSVVQFGKKTYRQCRGIPQGSVVSTLLCCLCYGHMENDLFKDIAKDKGCLLRLVDDFLLITPDLNEAQTFLKVLLAGVPQYGLVVNPQKVVINFDAMGVTHSLPNVRVLPSHCLFPWCGLLLDTLSLDVQKDYSSYAGLSFRYSLTLGSSQSAGQNMRRKLMSVLRLKCHSVFVDVMTNSLEAVYKNIYKLVLLHAYRFHVCALSLPFGQTVAKNPAYFLEMIWDLAKYTNHLIRLSNKGLVLGSKAQTGMLQFEAVELIFCVSFLLVLTQHRPLYKGLLPHLHKRKRSLEQRLGHLRLARVRQATNPRTPAEFQDIKL